MMMNEYSLPRTGYLFRFSVCPSIRFLKFSFCGFVPVFNFYLLLVIIHRIFPILTFTDFA